MRQKLARAYTWIEARAWAVLYLAIPSAIVCRMLGTELISRDVYAGIWIWAAQVWFAQVGLAAFAVIAIGVICAMVRLTKLPKIRL